MLRLTWASLLLLFLRIIVLTAFQTCILCWNSIESTPSMSSRLASMPSCPLPLRRSCSLSHRWVSIGPKAASVIRLGNLARSGRTQWLSRHLRHNRTSSDLQNPRFLSTRNSHNLKNWERASSLSENPKRHATLVTNSEFASPTTTSDTQSDHSKANS